MQLREFTNTVRGVVQRGLYEDVQRDAFKPLHITNDNFIDFALKGKYQAPSLIIIMSEEMQMHIRRKLITLGHKISSTQVDKFLKGDIALAPSLPNLKGRAGWDSKLSVIPELKATIQMDESKQKVFATASKLSMLPILS